MLDLIVDNSLPGGQHPVPEMNGKEVDVLQQGLSDMKGVGMLVGNFELNP